MFKVVRLHFSRARIVRIPDRQESDANITFL